MDNLSAVLTYLMSVKGIKCAELGRKTGIGQPVVYRLMTGTTDNPQIQTLKPLAEYFGVTIDQLIGLTPLNNQGTIDNTLLHNLNNKLSTIKTIASVFVDLLPVLIKGYQEAVSAKLIEEEISADILPLLPLNSNNLFKATNQIQDILTAINKKPRN